MKHLKFNNIFNLKRKYKLIFEAIVFIFSLSWMIINFVSNDYQEYNYIISIIMFILSTMLVFWVEKDYFKVYKQLKTFNFTMEFLIAISTHITYLFSLIFSIYKISTQSVYSLSMEFWDVAFALSLFVGIGFYLEDTLKRKTSLGIKDLLKLQQKKALVFNEIDNSYNEINSNLIEINQIVKIPKGASIPTDGILISDNAQLDCSSLLGESIPRNLKKGSQMLSGMINIGETLIYQSTKKMNDSMLNKIVLQLENILKNKSSIERISEKIVKWFLPIVLIIFLITFCIWLALAYNNINLKFAIANLDQLDYSNPWMVATYHSVATLVIACPCAFGIAAPAAIYSSSSLASKNKILFSSAKVYESINKIKYIAFDKTGTLTKNQIRVTKQEGKIEYNNIIYSLSKFSTHPLSKAINQYLSSDQLINLKKIKEIPGIGLFASDNDNQYFLGSLSYANEKKYFDPFNWDQYQDDLVVVFAINKKIITFFILEDQIKDDAKITIDKLKKINIESIILSGDRKGVVQKIANQLGIDNYYYDLLPTDKEKIIKQYQNIIFVGDGINDILALKAAKVGIAYSSGSEITNATADISILENDLDLVYKIITLSSKTIRLIKLNFLWASLFNLICIPLAIIGMIPAWLGVILMTCSTSILLINTLILRNRNKKLFET